MIKTEKLGKLSISLGLILVVFLLMAFVLGTTANADELDAADDIEVVDTEVVDTEAVDAEAVDTEAVDDVEVVEDAEDVALTNFASAVKYALPAVEENELTDVVEGAKDAVTGGSVSDIINGIINGDDPIDNDFASKEGNNFKGGPHWYLLIENYMFLPDDIEITLWSDLSAPHYYQVLTKANLVERLGYIRIPAGVPVYVKTNHDVDCYRMLKLTVEGAVIFDGNTGAPPVLHNNH